jgi:hypothetical protein
MEKNGHFVFYSRKNIQEIVLKDCLYRLFNMQPSFESKEVTFQTRTLNEGKSDVTNAFCYETNIYVPGHLILLLELFNNLTLTRKISACLDVELLIFNESDNPYLWLLVTKDNLFLVKENPTSNNDCISLDPEYVLKLSYLKALSLLPDKEYFYSSNNRAFYVTDYKQWEKCAEE